MYMSIRLMKTIIYSEYAVEIDKSTVRLKDGTILPIGGIYKEADWM